MLDLLLALNREEGTTMVLVTHEQALADSADRRIVHARRPRREPDDAAFLAHGPPHRLARAARLARAFLFVVLAVAVGVASLTGVRGFSRSFRHMLLSEARTLMAGDMTVRVFALPPPNRSRAATTSAAGRAPHLDHRDRHDGVVRRRRPTRC